MSWIQDRIDQERRSAERRAAARAARSGPVEDTGEPSSVESTGPGSPADAARFNAEDYDTAFDRAGMVALAKERGVKASGSKAAIIERLVENDAQG
jgi:hypothetical protein